MTNFCDKILYMSIAIFGDSIAYGFADEENGGWAGRLKHFLFVSGSGDEIYVYNLSIPGEDTEELLKRFEKECGILKPEKIIFAVGINDSAYYSDTGENQISEKDFKRNLEKLLEQARKFAKEIIFVGLTPVDESKTKPVPWHPEISYDNENVKKYDSVIKKFAESNNLEFMNLYKILNKKDLFDGVHPNASGHQKIFEKIKEKIF